MFELFSRRTGMVAIVAGLLYIFSQLGETLNLPRSAFPPIQLLFFLLFIPAMLGMHSVHARRNGALGRAGMILAVIGAGILTVEQAILTFYETVQGRYPPPDWTGIFTPIGFFLGFLLGNVLFGISAIRAKVLPQWGAVLLTIGLPVGFAIRLATDSLLGYLMYGLGLIWMGYFLWAGGVTTSGRVSSSEPPAVS